MNTKNGIADKLDQHEEKIDEQDGRLNEIDKKLALIQQQQTHDREDTSKDLNRIEGKVDALTAKLEKGQSKVLWFLATGAVSALVFVIKMLYEMGKN